MSAPLSLGIDIGGTFTDLVIHDPRTGRAVIWKESTTPDDPARGALEGTRRVLEKAGAKPQEIGRVARVEGDKAKCKVGDVIVKVDPRYYRPTEVETLLGDPTKAREKLGWTPKISLAELVAEMVNSDYTAAKRDSLVKSAGFQAYDYNE